jgi:DNA mismatch repair ATPase MutS
MEACLQVVSAFLPRLEHFLHGHQGRTGTTKLASLIWSLLCGHCCWYMTYLRQRNSTLHTSLTSNTYLNSLERTQLETLLIQIKPKELILEKGHISKATQKLIRNCVDDVQPTYLVSSLEFWDIDHTKDEVRRGGYFCGDADAANPFVEDEENMADYSSISS